MAIGFGTTLGVGSTDRLVYPAPSAFLGEFTFSVWVNRNGTGGGNLGRVIELDQSRFLIYNNFSQNSNWAIGWEAFTGTGGVKNCNYDAGAAARATGSWMHLCFTHDFSIPAQTGLNWTRSGFTATVSWIGHPFKVDDLFWVNNSSDITAITNSNVGGISNRRITSTTANTFSFTCLDAGALSGTLDGGKVPNFFWNGTQITTSLGQTDGNVLTDNGLYIGNRATGPNNRNFDGLIQELAFWDRVLNKDEIASLAKSFTPNKLPKNLLFYTPLVRETNDLKGKIASKTGTQARPHGRIF